MPQLDTLCTSLLHNMRSSVTPECFNTWFKELTLQPLNGHSVQIVAPNRYVRQWLEAHYKKDLLRSISVLMPEVSEIELTVANHSRTVDSSATLSKVLEQALPASIRADIQGKSSLRGNSSYLGSVSVSASNPLGSPACMAGTGDNGTRLTPLSPAMRLESFIVGKSNRIAHAAAQTVSETPAAVYNPLFLHGTPGLGKTHLLQGISHLLRERTRGNVAYLSSEQFTNVYVSAVQNKTLDAFRTFFRSCEALLLDDVQFLAGRDRTQEEFLHTFDSLRHANKQLVICGDCSPREMKRLDPKLAARFTSGLVVRMEAPDASLRVQLLQRKARDRGCSLPEDVTALLASHIGGSVRELEGVVLKLIALAAADAHPPDRELAIRALRELGYLSSGPLTLQDVLSAVVHHCGVSADEIRSDKRHAPLVRARHLGIYLSKILTSYSAAEIGRFYGNRDHATVVHAARKLTESIKRDENVRKEVEILRHVLGRQAV